MIPPRLIAKPGHRLAALALPLWLFACLAAPADMPSQGQILSDMILANTHFVNEWPTPGCTSCLSGSHPSNIWTRATYFEGALALYRINADPAIYTYAINWGAFFTWKLRGSDTTDFLPDDECCGASYIELYQTNTTQTQYLTHITANVNAWLANSNISLCNYVDALHMALPAWAKLGSLHVGVLTGNATYLSRMYTYFNNAKTTLGLYNTTDHLWYRDASFKSGYIAEDGTAQKCYWSRGEGWVMMALARILDVLPTTDAHYAEYVQTFQDMAAAVKTVQRSDGFWNVNLAYANDYPGPESSGTAMFVYGLAWGINKGYLSINTYLPTVIAGWNALAVGALHHTTGSDNGFLGYEQGSGDEPASGQPVTYTSVPDFDDFGLGAFLLAGSQVYALNALPTISTPPSNLTVTVGQSANFTVQASGNPSPSFQWQLNGANLTNSSRISGATSANLSVTNAQLSDAGNYAVLVSNLAGNATTTAVTLAVNQLPAFSTQPASQFIAAGQSAGFTVTASGTPAPTFQWQLSTNNGVSWGNLSNGTIYSGTTGTTLTVSNTTTALSGNQYHCVATNIVGSANSTTATLTVNTVSKNTWLQACFTPAELNNPAISGDTATPANDGISNLLKYAFNLYPWTNAQSLLPQAQTSSGELTLTFQLLRSELSYTVEASTDLLNWTTSGITLQSSGSNVTASYPVSASQPAFLRIVVTGL
jgi:rhamnogalacturonyl hydrolase YesR/predicted secreted protein